MASRSRGTKSAGSKLRAPSRARIVWKAKASTRKASSRKASSREVEKGPSTAPMRLPRIAKGKKPQYFSDPATDKLLWMTLTLMEELSVTRDRLDTVERLLAKRRLLTRKDIESWKPDDDASAERAARRAAYVDRMMRAVHRELEELTRGDMPTSEAEVIAAVEA
jgi:hypothetical protein